MFCPRFICLVTDFAILVETTPEISLLGAALCFLRIAPARILFESKDETLLPFEDPREHLAHPIALCYLQWPDGLKFSWNFLKRRSRLPLTEWSWPSISLFWQARHVSKCAYFRFSVCWAKDFLLSEASRFFLDPLSFSCCFRKGIVSVWTRLLRRFCALSRRLLMLRAPLL